MLHQLSSGASYEWLAEDRVIFFTLTSSEPEHIDAISNFLLRLLADWSPETPLLECYDFSRIILTTYGQKRAQEVHQNTPVALKGRTAIILQDMSIALKIIRFAEQNLPNEEGAFKRRYFLDQDAALRWLLGGTDALLETDQVLDQGLY